MQRHLLALLAPERPEAHNPAGVRGRAVISDHGIGSYHAAVGGDAQPDPCRPTLERELEGDASVVVVAAEPAQREAAVIKVVHVKPLDMDAVERPGGL